MFSEVQKRYEFGPFRLDPTEHTLLRGDQVVALTPKAFETLALLVQKSGHLVRKDELIESVWHDTVVEESNLNVIIHTLRKALGDDPRESKYIETVAKRGYRFVAEVRTAPDLLRAFWCWRVVGCFRRLAFFRLALDPAQSRA